MLFRRRFTYCGQTKSASAGRVGQGLLIKPLAYPIDRHYALLLAAAASKLAAAMVASGFLFLASRDGWWLVASGLARGDFF